LSKAGQAQEDYSKALTLVAKGTFEEAYLQYKSAWVHYNLKEPSLALKSLEALFEVTRDKLALKNEAVQDYALFLADVPDSVLAEKGSYSGVYAYLSKQTETQAAVKALERLAVTYAKNGRRLSAINVHEFLIGETQMSPDNVGRALTVVEWSNSLADKDKITDRYFWLISNFGPTSAWYAAQVGLPQIQTTALDAIEAAVRKYAIQLHEQAQKESNAELRSKRELVVAKLYDAHIGAFSRNVDVPRASAGRVHFYRAEIHRRNQEFAEAGKRYDFYLRILDVVPTNELEKIDLKIRYEAIWGSVQVWSKAIEKDAKLAPNMLGAADRFLKEMGQDPKAPQVLLDAALVEERAGNRVVAARRLETLIKDYPKTPQTMTAVNASLDILNRENDWINLAQRARLFVNSIDSWATAAEKPKMKADLLKILSQTEAKSCEALQKQVDRQLEAALCYERFAKGFEKDEQAPKALLLAADIYDKLKDAPSALSSLEILVKKYPSSEFSAGGFSRLAKVYEKAFEFEKAISIYETLLSKGKDIQEREKILVRLLVLYSGLGDRERLGSWLSRKDTPEKLRREYAERQRDQDLVSLRFEERKFGYSEKGRFASDKAEKIFSSLEKKASSGRADIEEMLEIHRIRGIFHRLSNRLDKADEEWMAGLKAFWKAKEKSSQVWSAAARIRLEQGSLWETVFANTNFIKNPSRKAELYQKLEGWYAEVVEMKAPEVALAALWKSAELNRQFADDVRNSEVPVELLKPENQKELVAYKKALNEKTEPLKQKAFLIVQRIAEKAKEWKVISPEVISSLKVVENLKNGTELPGRLVQVDENEVLKFPWSNLPRWVDLNQEQMAWSEWQLSPIELRKNLLSQQRGQSRRAAFVKLLRDGSLADKEVQKWARTFVDRAGVQLRIQAMLSEGEHSLAGLFLDQYESFFGSDAFVHHYWGQLEWSKENYSAAYLRWVRPSLEADQDFRTVYWNEGWSSLFDALSSGKSSRSRQKEVFSRLAPLAKDAWNKHYLVKLCLEEQAECRDQFSNEKIFEMLSTPGEVHLAQQFNDGSSTFETHRRSIGLYVHKGLIPAKKYDDLERLRKALSGLYQLAPLAFQDGQPNGSSLSSTQVFAEYNQLKKLIDLRQENLDSAKKGRVLAGAGG
jgi:hypothetical protein